MATLPAVKALALDFDGVISDSAPEAFAVALRAFVDLRAATPLREELEAVWDAGTPALERIRARPAYAVFLETMPLGNRAEDFGVELLLLEQGARVVDQAAYDAFRAGVPAAFLDGFHRRFYQVRETFSRDDPQGWRALLSPYPEFVSLLRRRAGDALLAIATAKDRRSVRLLLRDYGIADLFPEACVLDKDVGVSKTAHLRRLHELVGVPFAEITFIDDKVNHLDAASELGVRCALSAWGYNGERERRLARERGYLVCTLVDAERRLFG
jgi:phosphoglycolate phosphatase-like HAD superfamily hydrolase